MTQLMFEQYLVVNKGHSRSHVNATLQLTEETYGFLG